MNQMSNTKEATMPETQTVVEPKRKAGRPKKIQTVYAPQDQAPVDTIVISKKDLEELMAARDKARDAAVTPSGFSVEAFGATMEKILANSNASQKLTLAEALKVNSRPSNNMLEYPGISVYNPLGERDHPRSRLVDKNGRPRITTYGGCPMNLLDTLVEEEILAFNAIKESCTAENGQWVATVERKGDAETLNITLGDLANPSINRSIPPLTQVLYQLKMNKPMPNINALIAQRASKEADPEAYINGVFDQIEALMKNSK